MVLLQYRNRSHLNQDDSVKHSDETTQTDPLLTHSSGDLRSDFFKYTTKDVRRILSSNRLLAKQLRRRLTQAKSNEQMQHGKLTKLAELPNLKHLRTRLGFLSEPMDHLDDAERARIIAEEERRSQAAISIQARQRGNVHRSKLQLRLKARTRRAEEEDLLRESDNNYNDDNHDDEQDDVDLDKGDMWLAARVKGGNGKGKSATPQGNSLRKIKRRAKKKSEQLAKLKSITIAEERGTIVDVCYYCKKPGHWKINCPDLALHSQQQKLQQKQPDSSASGKPGEMEVADDMIEGYPDTPWGRGMAMVEKTPTTVDKRLPGFPHYDDQCYYCNQVTILQ